MYTSKSYDGIVYVALPSLFKGGKYLWYILKGDTTPEYVTADIVPPSVRRLAYNQFWERRKGC